MDFYTESQKTLLAAFDSRPSGGRASQPVKRKPHRVRSRSKRTSVR